MYFLKQASATSHDRMRRKPTITGQSPLGSGFRLRRTTGGLLADDTKIRALYLQMSGNFANIAGQSRRFGRQRRQSVPLYRHCPLRPIVPEGGMPTMVCQTTQPPRTRYFYGRDIGCISHGRRAVSRRILRKAQQVSGFSRTRTLTRRSKGTGRFLPEEILRRPPLLLCLCARAGTQGLPCLSLIHI